MVRQPFYIKNAVPDGERMDKLKGKFKAFPILVSIACAAILLVVLLVRSNNAGQEPGSAGPGEGDIVVSVDADVSDITEVMQTSGQGQDSAPDTEPESGAVYLGIKDYGLDEINKDNIENFVYLFEIDGEVFEYRVSDENPDYPIQNALKEGYYYYLTEEDGTIIDVEEIIEKTALYDSPVAGTPGERTLTNYLETALMPVGTTLYIYGGGWDWQDEGSSIQARTLGVSPDWITFFNDHDEDYTYRDPDNDPAKSDPTTSYYPYGRFNEYYYAGLDCSGYVGWVIYNTFETENGLDGYVGASTRFARRLSGYGFGDWTQNIRMPDGRNGYEMKPGDVMSINGHVWISLGTCDDGSVVIVHSTPSRSRTGQPGGGVQISAVGWSDKCEAYILADHYMSEYYPEWYERYPIYLCDPGVYFAINGEYAGRFTWDVEGGNGLADPDGLQDMEPEEVLLTLFASAQK